MNFANFVEGGEQKIQLKSVGTDLTSMSLTCVASSPLELRRHAEHCRRLAFGLLDERTRTILMTMAAELEKQALDSQLENVPKLVPPAS